MPQGASDVVTPLPPSPPKGGSKREFLHFLLKMRIFTFGVALYFFVAGNRRHVKFISFSVLSHEIGFEERLRNDIFLSGWT